MKDAGRDLRLLLELRPRDSLSRSSLGGVVRDRDREERPPSMELNDIFPKEPVVRSPLLALADVGVGEIGWGSSCGTGSWSTCIQGG